MPINISDIEVENLGSSAKNLDYQTLDVISRMPFNKARMADIVDPQTKQDTSFKVKRELSTLAALIGRKLKYYNHKDYPTQVPEGQVGFAVVSENTSPLDVQAAIKDLEAWRAKQAEVKPSVNGTAEAPKTPEPQTGTQETPETSRGNRRPS